MSTAEAYRAHAATFTRLVEGTTDWNAPSPVEEWRAHDVVEHLTTWLPGMLRGLGVDLPDVTSDDPVEAWRELDGRVQALLDDPATAGQRVTNFQGDEVALEDLLAQYYVPDVFMHAWDLARATGQPLELDPPTTQALVDGMSDQVEMLRTSGQFGNPVLLDSSHSPQDRLIALIGRDPGWSPPEHDPGLPVDELANEVPDHE
ncbi:maleylpyruvate isomerase family mycothiol-dependent enzyme [Aestuariimicrobium soli]|uniref:maleylpyruvate isomerase family mycothiol-dependent enzyme n=1 Tax=Aestuariimicrobium soli TaxID=2035834 RepID=UPI003EBD2B4A